MTRDERLAAIQEDLARFDKVRLVDAKWLLAEVERVAKALELVEEQAKDEGLWFQAETAPEAYLQYHLRQLHAELEGDHPEPQKDATQGPVPADDRPDWLKPRTTHNPMAALLRQSRGRP